MADFFDFGGGVEDSRFKTFRFFDSKRELFEKLASELKILSVLMTRSAESGADGMKKSVEP